MSKIIKRVTQVSIITLALAAGALAQVQRPVITAKAAPQMAVATGNDLYCAGYIQSRPMGTENKIIGARNEADGFNFAQNDFVYINMGRDKGVNVGDVFSVVRPRGGVKSKWSRKGDLGYYVQELGSLEVVDVKQSTSAVRVKWSCDSFLMGDLVQRWEQRPMLAAGSSSFDRFAGPSGKATGRIIMARDGAEALARNFVAYVDLGTEDRVQIGDVLTIYRPLAKGNLTEKPGESASSRDYGFESDVYRGGKFSNQSTRKKGDNARGKEVRTSEIRDERPSDMRKIVGEAVVLNVKDKTATVKITRNEQEIHTGDWVEIK